MTIHIRRATVKDAAAYARVMAEADVFANLLQMPYADEEAWRQRLADSTAPTKPDINLVAELDGELVATAGLHPIGLSVRRRHSLGLGLSVAGHAQGKGVGTALMQALCDYADNWAGVLRIELSVFEDNARAIALYRKFGFEIEGTHRCYAMRNGVYATAYSMARLHPKQPMVNTEARP